MCVLFSFSPSQCDQAKEGLVNSSSQMDDYCKERGFAGWFETSAKENINIDEAARFLVSSVSGVLFLTGFSQFIQYSYCKLKSFISTSSAVVQTLSFMQ